MYFVWILILELEICMNLTMTITDPHLLNNLFRLFFIRPTTGGLLIIAEWFMCQKIAIFLFVVVFHKMIRVYRYLKLLI